MKKHIIIMILILLFSGSESFAGPIYRVTAQSGLKVRIQPNTSCSVLGALSSGEEIEVLSIESGWGSVFYNGKKGYVFMKYMSLVRESEPEPVSELTKDSDMADSAPNSPDTVYVWPVLDFVKTKWSSWKIALESCGDKFEGDWRDYLQINALASAHMGSSNIFSEEYTPRALVGLGLDAGAQLYLNENYGFFPRWFCAESSVGYAIKGCGAKPIHCFQIRFLPLGYRSIYRGTDISYSGNIGIYADLSHTYMTTGTKSDIYSGNDIGLYIKISAARDNLSLSLTYESGFCPIVRSAVDFYNRGLQFHVAYNFYDITNKTANHFSLIKFNDNR